MDEIESEELACAALGLNYEEGIDNLDEILYDKLGVSLQQFQTIAELLMPLTLPGEAMITRQLFHGFVKDDVFIVKSPYEGDTYD